jgi:hypothetical protein
MTASDHLNPQQFMPLSEFKKTYSGDYDVPITRVESEMRANWRAHKAGESYEDPHPGEVEHGGPVPYLAHLTRDISKNGLREPITIRNENNVYDGNHRAAAVLRLGLDPVPVRHVT